MLSPKPLDNAAASPRARIAGRATPQETLRYAARFQGRSAAGHFREAPGGLLLSSIGIGTYLGEPDRATDEAYTAAVYAAVEGGANVVDTAINYRFQRSERSIGAALGQLLSRSFSRAEIVLCTKAGFLTPDGEMPADPNEYFSRELVEPGILRPEEIAAGCHCMAPRFLADQLERSLGNLGVECVDIFYLHNPETQLTEIPADEFRHRIREAFAFLESAVAAGKIGAYGMATWNAFRDDPRGAGYLSLAEMAAIAREAGGPDHHFRFVQLPLNLAMPEAFTRPNQVVEGNTMAMVKAARILGITLVASASLLQGQLSKNLPPYIRAALGPHDDSALALQFVRSVPGVTTALAGMSRIEHVRANLALVAVEPAPRDQLLKLFAPHA
jgi:aryl-alcohol dehydrogenase-like predicted oxidoreductase